MVGSLPLTVRCAGHHSTDVREDEDALLVRQVLLKLCQYGQPPVLFPESPMRT
jgi:hypothetical protein